MKHKRLFEAFTLACLLFLPFCLVWAQGLEKIIDGAKKEGKVRVGITVRWEVGGKPLAKKLVAGFQSRYPFVKVDYKRVGGSRVRERILSEIAAGKVPYDVTVISSTQVSTVQRAKIAQMVDWRSLGIHPRLIPPNRFGASANSQVYGIAYNRKLLPDSVGMKLNWEDCISPKWKGKVAMDTRPRHLEVFWQPHVWGREKTLNHARQLEANGTVFQRSRSATMIQLALGEYPIVCGTFYHTYFEYLTYRAARHLRFITGDPVPVTPGSFLYIPRGATYPNAAKLWVIWLLSEEGQLLLDEVHGSGSPVFEGTKAAKLIKGKEVAWYEPKWQAKSRDILKEILQAVGLPVAR